MKDKKLKYIDLFAGCGGLSLGLHQSGAWEGLFAIEKSPDAFATLKYNLIDKKKHFSWVGWLPKKEHDINFILKKYKIELKKLKNTVDLVAGGPPCQGFSTAGRRVEDDERNFLIKSYIEFIRLVQPKIIFFENVKGFTIGFKNNEKRGKAYSKFVLEELEKLGYQVQGELIDFSNYGIPQKRTRFILVGIRNDIIKQNNLSEKSFFTLIKENKKDFLLEKKLLVKPTLEEAISDLLKSNGTINSPDTKNFEAGIYGQINSNYQKKLRGGRKNVDSHRFAKHTKRVKERFSIAIEENLGAKAYRERFNLKKTSTKLLKSNKPTPTITTLPDDYIHYCEPRILTVREYARIQSFPDFYEFKGKYTTGGSCRKIEVPRYSQIGNAIPPLFAEQVGLILKKIADYE